MTPNSCNNKGTTAINNPGSPPSTPPTATRRIICLCGDCIVGACWLASGGVGGLQSTGCGVALVCLTPATRTIVDTTNASMNAITKLPTTAPTTSPHVL